MNCLKDREFVTIFDCEQCELVEKCIHASEPTTGIDPRFIVLVHNELGVPIPQEYRDHRRGWKTENERKWIIQLYQETEL